MNNQQKFIETVRLARTETGWPVAAGPKNKPTIIGFIVPAYNISGKRAGWAAQTTQAVKLAGKPFGKGDDAVVRLVEHHLNRCNPAD